MKYALICLLLFPYEWAYADSNAVAHVAGSAVMTCGVYILMSALTGREKRTKKPALAAAILTTLAVGLAIEIGDSIDRRDRRLDGRDLTANVVGVGLATAGIIALEF